MLRVLSAGLLPKIANLAAKADRKRAAVAYVTSDAQVKFGKGDALVTDAGDEPAAVLLGLRLEERAERRHLEEASLRTSAAGSRRDGVSRR
jgi:hypothetical protein